MRSKVTAKAVPAARSDGLLIESIGDETVIYDTDSKQAHCLRPLAAIVFSSCDGHATVAEIANTTRQRLGGPVSDSDVADAVAQLESLGLLQSALVVRAGGGLVATRGRGISRRDMLRRVGFAGAAAAVGTPLVTTIVAPDAIAQGASGIATGCSGCGTNSDCASGHCCTKGAISGKTCQNGCCVGRNNSCHISGCTCSIGGASCLARACGATEGTCVCTCTVCSTDPGGCGACPPGVASCCNALACTQPLLDDPDPTPTPEPTP